MSNTGIKNLPASIHQRLLNKARERNRPFNELLQYYAMERFLYRLSESDHKKEFFLKGAVLLTTWGGEGFRATADIDLLGTTSNQVEDIVDTMKAVGLQSVEPDGLLFDPHSFEGMRIAEDARYQGVRVKFRGNLGKAIILMQVDVGFGDVISPSPQKVDYPSILDLPQPRILGYSKESVIAEKFEAMVTLGALNSRMKDFYDVWRLSRQFPFDGSVLSVAIEKTFSRRGTEIQATPFALSADFSRTPGKQAQWAAFRKTSQLEDAPPDLSNVSRHLAFFFGPIADHLSVERAFHGLWEPPGPWE